MKIILDTRICKCWDAACSAHFSSHFLGEEVTPIDCVVDMIEDDNREITFQIKDRDGTEKTLVVGKDNYADAYDSWREAWEKQQAASTKDS
jgi:hypothetical protein